MDVIARKKPTISISQEEMERRREAVRRANAHLRLEDLRPDPVSMEVYEEFIRGEIELQDVRPRIQALQLTR